MTPESVFSVCNSAVLPAWLLLAIGPGWTVTRWVVHTAAISLGLATVYLAIMIAKFSSAEGDFGSLEGVTQLFADPWILLGGWIHYLAFDLFIGAWIVRDGRRLGYLGFWHLVLVPCLFLTLMLGPVGLLVYVVICRWPRRQFLLDECLPTAG